MTEQTGVQKSWKDFQANDYDAIRAFIKSRYRAIHTKPNLIAQMRGLMTMYRGTPSAIPQHALVLDEPHGQRIVSGDEFVVLLPGDIGYENENLYLIENGTDLLGVIMLEKEATRPVKQMVHTELEHHRSQKECHEKWPDLEKICSYRVFPVFTFSTPFKCEVSFDSLPSLVEDAYLYF